MSRWIDVKNKPIPTMKDILICNQYQIAWAWYLPGNNKPVIKASESPFEANVTHWMHLPILPLENRQASIDELSMSMQK